MRHPRFAGRAGAALLLLTLAGCSQPSSTPRELTQRQRDSTLGRSALPGAFVVTRALEASDRVEARSQDVEQQAGTDAP